MNRDREKKEGEQEPEVWKEGLDVGRVGLQHVRAPSRFLFFFYTMPPPWFELNVVCAFSLWSFRTQRLCVCCCPLVLLPPSLPPSPSPLSLSLILATSLDKMSKALWGDEDDPDLLPDKSVTTDADTGVTTVVEYRFNSVRSPSLLPPCFAFSAYLFPLVARL